MGLINQILARLTQKIIEFLPRLFSVIIFLIIAVVVLQIINRLLHQYLSKNIEEDVVLQIGTLLFKIFAYYAIILSIIAILGLNQLAASLGTAIGFLALGVSFAMKNVINDLISGFYLIKDDDFRVGDMVESEKGKGKIKEIGIKKTRLKTEEENTLVLANSDIEKKWTKMEKKN